MGKMIEIGFCDKPHGIKGGFVFKLYHPKDSFLIDNMSVLLLPKTIKSSLPKEGKFFEIEKISFGNKVICYLKNIKDINEAETILPFSINIPRSIFPKTNENEYYVADLIGLEVCDHLSKQKIGKILDFYENGGQIIFIIEDHGRKMDIPFTESFFPVVDITSGKVEINRPIMVED